MTCHGKTTNKIDIICYYRISKTQCRLQLQKCEMLILSHGLKLSLVWALNRVLGMNRSALFGHISILCMYHLGVVPQKIWHYVKWGRKSELWIITVTRIVKRSLFLFITVLMLLAFSEYSLRTFQGQVFTEKYS